MAQEVEQKLSETQQQLEREQTRGNSLRAEKDILLNAEHRLANEVDALIKERHSQNTLLANLQARPWRIQSRTHPLGRPSRTT